MRISDWSSDVCSSDLIADAGADAEAVDRPRGDFQLEAFAFRVAGIAERAERPEREETLHVGPVDIIARSAHRQPPVEHSGARADLVITQGFRAVFVGEDRGCRQPKRQKARHARAISARPTPTCHCFYTGSPPGSD